MEDSGCLSVTDDDIEELIRKELEDIDIIPDEEENDDGLMKSEGSVDSINGVDGSSELNKWYLSQYLDIIQNNSKSAEKILFESKEALEVSGKEIKELTHLKFKEIFSQEGIIQGGDLLQIREDALAEIERIEYAEKVNMETLPERDAEKMTVAIIQPNIVDKIAALEEKATDQLLTLKAKHAEEERQQKVLLKEEEIRRQVEEEESLKKQKIERTKLERRLLEEEEKEKTRKASMDMIMKEKQAEIQELEGLFQTEMRELEKNKVLEHEKLQQLRLEESERKAQRQNGAALLIQKNFKRYRVRKTYGPKLIEMKKERKRKEQECLAKMEEVEARIRKENEQKRKEEIEKKRKEEEDHAKRMEEARKAKERLIAEEKRKAEERRIAEEQKKEEEKRVKEKIRKEEEERLLEEKRKLEEKRVEEEKLREEQRKREEEIRREEIRKEEQRKKEEIRIAEERKEKEERKKEESRRRAEEQSKQEDIRKEEERRKAYERKKEEEKRLAEEKEEEKKQVDKRKAKEEIILAENQSWEEEDRIIKESKEDENSNKKEQKLNITHKNIEDELEKTKINKENDVRMEKEVEVHEEETLKELTVPKCSEETTVVKEDRSSTANCLQIGRCTEDEDYLMAIKEKWIREHANLRSEPRKSHPKGSASRRGRKKSAQNIAQAELSSELLLAASRPGTTIEEVQAVVLKDLTSISLTGLQNTTEVKVVQIQNSDVLVVDGLHRASELIELDLQANKVDQISSINGNSLKVLKLANNQISSFHGIDNCVKLEEIDISSNKVTRMNGLPACSSLVHLNVGSNQLISTKNFGFYGNLLTLDVSNNHLTSLSEIEYLPLLKILNVEGNSIHEIPTLKNNALLQELHLGQNSISDITSLSSSWLPLLQILKLPDNSITKLPCTRNLISLSQLDLRNNLIQSATDLTEGLFQSRSLCELVVAGNPCTTDSTLRYSVLNAIHWLTKLDEEVIDKKVPNKMFSELEIQSQRQIKEWNNLSRNHADDSSMLHQKSTKLVLSEAVVEKVHMESQHRQDCLAMAIRHLQEQLGEDDKNNMLISSRCISTASSTKFYEEEVDLSSTQTKENETSPKTSHHSSAFIENEGEPAFKISPLKKVEEDAAIKIQALHRGYMVRKKLHKVLNSGDKMDPGDSDEFDYDEEVDLAAFDYDESTLDWRAPSTPQFPQKYPKIPPSNKTENITAQKVTDARHAWVSPAATPEINGSKDTKFLNEINSGDNRSVSLSRVSSKRADELSNEWGFKNSATAEMMMKRAKRMMQSKSKLKSDADKRLASFKKVKAASNTDVLPSKPRKRQEDRTSYFPVKPHEIAAPASSQDNEYEAKRIMTYRWVHDQAVLHREEHSDIIAQHGNKHSTGSQQTSPQGEVTLPYLDADIIAGRRVPLISYPLQTESRNRSDQELGHARCLKDNKPGRVGCSEKSHSAPSPSQRTPPVTQIPREDNSRSGSAEIRWRRFSYKR